jgi:hypothetical protein
VAELFEASKGERPFTVIRRVECNQYVYLHLFGPRDWVENPGLVAKRNRLENPIERCRDVFEGWFAAADKRVAGGDAIVFDATTFRENGTHYKALGEGPERQGGTALLSGVTGLSMNSSPAYLTGWLIKFNSTPSRDELRRTLHLAMDPLAADGNLRLAAAQVAAAAHYLRPRGSTIEWNWVDDVVDALPAPEKNGLEVSGFGDWGEVAGPLIEVVADQNAESVRTYMERFLIAAADRKIFNGTNLAQAARAVACHGSKSMAERLAQTMDSNPDMDMAVRLRYVQVLKALGREDLAVRGLREPVVGRWVLRGGEPVCPVTVGLNEHH